MGALRRKRPDTRHRLFAIDATLGRSSLAVNPLWPLPRRRLLLPWRSADPTQTWRLSSSSKTKPASQS